MSTRRRKFINVGEADAAYAALIRVGIGDPVVLVTGDIQVTVTVDKLEKVAPVASPDRTTS